MPAEAVLLFDSADQPFAGWWALALAWGLVLIVAIGPIWLHLNDAAGRLDTAPGFLPYLIWLVFFLSVASAGYWSMTVTREDRALRAASKADQCRVVEGVVQHLGPDGALSRERFVLQGLGFAVDSTDNSIAYSRLSRENGIIQADRAFRLCYVARGRELEDRAILKIWSLDAATGPLTPIETRPSDFWVGIEH